MPASVTPLATRLGHKFYARYINSETDLPAFLVRIREKRFQTGRSGPDFAAPEGPRQAASGGDSWDCINTGPHACVFAGGPAQDESGSKTAIPVSALTGDA